MPNNYACEFEGWIYGDGKSYIYVRVRDANENGRIIPGNTPVFEAIIPIETREFPQPEELPKVSSFNARAEDRIGVVKFLVGYLTHEEAEIKFRMAGRSNASSQAISGAIRRLNINVGSHDILAKLKPAIEDYDMQRAKRRIVAKCRGNARIDIRALDNAVSDLGMEIELKLASLIHPENFAASNNNSGTVAAMRHENSRRNNQARPIANTISRVRLRR